MSVILDSLNSISDSKVQDSNSIRKIFRDSRIPIRGDLDNSRLLLQAIVFMYRSILHSFLLKHKYFDPQAGMNVVRNWIKPNKSGFHVLPE